MSKLPGSGPPSGSRTGPFTVDSGGGRKARGGGSMRVPERPPLASPRLSKPSTPTMSPSAMNRTAYPHPSHLVSPFHIPAVPRSQEGSVYRNVDLPSIATTTNLLTPVDPAGGLSSSGGRHGFTPVGHTPAFPVESTAERHHGTVSQMSTTPLDPPPSPWSSHMLNGYTMLDWNDTPTTLPWNGHPGSSIEHGKEADASIDPAIFSSLAELIEQGQSNATDNRGRFDLGGALGTVKPTSRVSLDPPSREPGWKTSRMQQQQGLPYAHPGSVPGSYSSSFQSSAPLPRPLLADSGTIGQVSTTPPRHPPSNPSQPPGRGLPKATTASSFGMPKLKQAVPYNETSGASTSGIQAGGSRHANVGR